MFRNVFNVSTLLFAPILGLSLWGQNVNYQNETNYRRIDELEVQVEAVLQKTDNLDSNLQVAGERIEQFSYLSQTIN